jgi:chromosome segregation ATPase
VYWQVVANNDQVNKTRLDATDTAHATTAAALTPMSDTQSVTSEELDKLKAYNNQLLTQLSELQQQKTEAQLDNDKRIASFTEEMAHQIQSRQIRIDELQSQLSANSSAAATEIQTLHDKLTAALHDKEALEASIIDIRDSYEQSITATAAQTADTIARLDTNIQQLQSDLSQSAEQRHIIELQLQHVTSERDEHAIVVQQLNDSISTLQTQIDALQASNAAILSDTQSTTDETVLALQQQLAIAVANGDTANATIDDLNKQITEVSDQLQQRTSMYEAAIHDVNSMQSTVADLQSELSRLQDQVVSTLDARSTVEASLVEARSLHSEQIVNLQQTHDSAIHEVQQQHVQLNSKYVNIQSELSNAHEQHNEVLTKATHEHTEAIASLQTQHADELHHVVTKSEALAIELRAFQESHDTLLASYIAVQFECEQLKQHADTTTEIIATLQKQLTDMTALRLSDSANATAAYIELQTQLTSLQTEYDTLQTSVHESQQQYASKLRAIEFDMQQWQDKALQYEATAADSSKLHQAHIEELQLQLSANSSAAATETQALHDKLTAALHDNEVLEASIIDIRDIYEQSLTATATQTADKIAALDSNIQQSQLDLTQSVEQKHIIELQLQHVTSERDEHAIVVQQLNDSNKTLHTQISELQAANAAVLSDTQSTTDETVLALQQQLAIAVANVDTANATIDDLNKQITELTDQLQQRTSMYETATHDANSMHATVANLQSELSTLQSQVASAIDAKTAVETSLVEARSIHSEQIVNLQQTHDSAINELQQQHEQLNSECVNDLAVLQQSYTELTAAHEQMQTQLLHAQNELSSAHEQHNEVLTAAKHEHAEAIAALQTQHADELHQAEDKMHTAVTQCETLTVKLSALQESHDTFLASYTAVQRECEQLKLQADVTTETSTTIATLQQQLSDITVLKLSESSNATAAYTELQTQLTSLQTEYDTLTSSMHESQEQYASKLNAIEVDKQQWQGKALQYETTMADSGKIHQAYIDELQSQLSANSSAAATEIQALHDKLTAALHDNEASQANITDMRISYEQSITATAAQTADEIARLDTNIQQLQSDLSQSAEQRHTIELQLQHVTSERDEHAILVQQLNDSNKTLHTQISELQAANTAVLSDTQSTTDETVLALQQQLAIAVANVDTANATIDDLNKQITEVSDQLQQRTSMYEAAIHDVNSMHATVANLQSELSTLQSQVASAIDAKTTVETSLVEARSLHSEQIVNLQQTHDNVIQELQQQHEHLNSKYVNIQSELSSAHEQHSKLLTAANHEHAEAIAALQTQKHTEVQQFTDKMRTLITKFKESKLEQQTLQESHDALKASYTAVQTECAQLKQQVDASTETSTVIAALQQELSDMTALRLSDSANATAAYTDLQTQLTSLQTEHDTLQTSMHELQEQYASKLSAIEVDKQQWQDKALQYEATAADAIQRQQEYMDKLQKVMIVCTALEATSKVC